MSAARRKGTAFESLIVDTLRSHGWIHAERRALAGAKDRGDIAGVPGVVIEAKAAKAITLAAWMDELEAEVANDNAAHGALWIKRRGRGSALGGYIVVDPADYLLLLKEAGY